LSALRDIGGTKSAMVVMPVRAAMMRLSDLQRGRRRAALVEDGFWPCEPINAIFSVRRGNGGSG